MYNPTEGKLRKNKYLNIGYENSPTWETRKLIADCVEYCLDNYCDIEYRDSVFALSLVQQFKHLSPEENKAEELFRRILDKKCPAKMKVKYNKLLKCDRLEKRLVSEILCIINSGPFCLDYCETRERNK